MDKLQKQIREQLEALSKTKLGDPNPKYRLTDKRLAYFDRSGKMQKERFANLSQAEKKAYTKRRREEAGYSVEIIDSKGKSKEFNSVSEASAYYGWPTIKNVPTQFFPPDGSWAGIKMGKYKGFFLRRIKNNKARPPLPKIVHGGSMAVEVKAPNGKWQKFSSASEAMNKLGWASIGADTKKYFSENGDVYTQRLGVRKGWQTKKSQENQR